MRVGQIESLPSGLLDVVTAPDAEEPVQRWYLKLGGRLGLFFKGPYVLQGHLFPIGRHTQLADVVYVRLWTIESES